VRKFTFGFVTTFIIYFIYGLILSQFQLNVITNELEPNHPSGFYDYKGVVNVHSLLSTGTGTFEEIVKSAQDSNLDFIFFTDLNNFKKESSPSGYYNKLLVFIDGEYSYLDSRLLNIHSKSENHLQGPGRSQVLFADLLSQENKQREEGLFILAHPYKPNFKWTGQYPPGLDGVEIINLKSIWQRASQQTPLSFAWTLLLYPFNPELSFIRLFQNPTREIALWDTLSAQRKSIAIAGADAEAKFKFFDGSLKFPSYQTLFNIVRNHVLLSSELTGDTQRDQEKIGQALRRGQFYMSLDIMANPKGFVALIKDNNNQYPLGSEVQFKKGLKLIVKLPQKPLVPFETVIFKNGKKFLISNSKDTEIQIHGPGVYRAIVRVIPTFPLPDGKKWVPWIYTNPFYVK